MSAIHGLLVVGLFFGAIGTCAFGVGQMVFGPDRDSGAEKLFLGALMGIASGIIA